MQNQVFKTFVLRCFPVFFDQLFVRIALTGDLVGIIFVYLMLMIGTRSYKMYIPLGKRLNLKERQSLSKTLCVFRPSSDQLGLFL